MPTNKGQAPGTVTLSGGWALSLPENGDNKDATFDFVKHMMSEKHYLDLVLFEGDICTRKDIAEKEEYKAQPFFEFGTKLLDTAGYRPQNDLYSSVSTGIQEMVESVVTGTSIDDAISQYASNTASIVGDDNVVNK